LQSRADLTQRSQVMVVNRINREVFALTSSFNQTVGFEDMLFIEKFVKRCTAINEADATRGVGSKTSERKASGQRYQAASGEVRFRRQADTLKAGAKVFAPKILHIDTAAPGIVPGK